MAWVSKTFESLLPLHPYFIKYYFIKYYFRYSLSAFSPLQMNSFLNTEMPGIDGIKSNVFLWEICIIKGFRLLHSTITSSVGKISNVCNLWHFLLSFIINFTVCKVLSFGKNTGSELSVRVLTPALPLTSWMNCINLLNISKPWFSYPKKLKVI